MKLSLGQLRKLVNQKYSLIEVLKKANPSGNYHVGGTCYCPFHDNTDTPSASIYDDENGEKLYCFSEGRLYGVDDAIEKLLKYDVYEVGSALWDRMSEEEQGLWLVSNSVDDYGEMFNQTKGSEKHSENRELVQAKEKFKRGDIPLSELLSWYIKDYEDKSNG